MINKINDWVAMNLTLAMSSIWCVYIFFMIAIAPLFFPKLEQLCIYLSTTIIQLVALPAILVGTKLLSKSTETRAEQDHNALMEAIQDLHQIMTEEDSTSADVAILKFQVADIHSAVTTGSVYK